MDKKNLKPLPKTMQQWVMKSRPQGVATYDNFELQTVPLPTIGDGEILIKTLYLGVAPVTKGKRQKPRRKLVLCSGYVK
jgi:NADPH-dependent curcumin reductase